MANKTEQADMDFEMIESFKIDKKSLIPQTYFTLINDNRNPILPGEQVFNCYGKRTNMQLLRNYGFCL